MRQFLTPVLTPVLIPALTALAALGLAAAAAPSTSAHHVCNDYGQMTDSLKAIYGERKVSSRAKEKDRRVEFWASKKGSWSVVLVLPNGRSCLQFSAPEPFTEKLRLDPDTTGT